MPIDWYRKVSAIRSHNSTGTIRREASAERFAITLPAGRATGRGARSSSLEQFSPLLD